MNRVTFNLLASTVGGLTSIRTTYGNLTSFLEHCNVLPPTTKVPIGHWTRKKLSTWTNAPTTLALKVGAQVVLLKNLVVWSTGLAESWWGSTPWAPQWFGLCAA